jgi:hypothetical protein
VLIRSLGSSTRAVFFLSYFITWRFRLAVGWISRQYIHHYFAKIKADFAT